MVKKLPRFKIKLNANEELEALLQELYDETCKNIVEIDREISRLTNSVDLSIETMDGKAKYAKAINDYSTNKNKALATKMDVAKMMVEIIKFNGNSKKALEEMEAIPDDWGDAMQDALSDDSAASSKKNDLNIRKYIL